LLYCYIVILLHYFVKIASFYTLLRAQVKVVSNEKIFPNLLNLRKLE